MLSLHCRSTRLCDSFSRRELLAVGGLSALGLTLPGLLKAREQAPLGIPGVDKTFGRAKNIIYLYLQGGPPQHETFDPKPDAPAEIRGAFQPIQTNVPGIQFCELLPRTARMADKLAVVRSMSTNDNTHSSSGYWVLTGYKYRGPNPRTIQSTDWPYFGSLVKMLKPSESLPPLSTVWVPDIMRLNESVTPAGQTAGFLGSSWHPDRFVGDPSEPDYEVEGLRLTDLPPLRLRERERLLDQVDRHFRRIDRGDQVNAFGKFQQQAFDLLTSGKAREAFAIGKEPEIVRARYGRGQWSQCVLLARRLIEAGVRLVHVNWPREPGDNAVDNPLWDTHAQNADRLEDVLCPKFDVGFTALIEDLDQRGLLDETLVVAIGEFGRTPKINAKAGRDHWGPVFSFAMAGAGISGGQVYGASDKQGAYPAQDRLTPGDLTATIFHLLGISHLGTFNDREGRPQKLTEGEPIRQLLGIQPATTRRTPPGGDISRVPPYSNRLLIKTDFGPPCELRSFQGSSRPKGWRVSPLIQSTGQAAPPAFGARLLTERHQAALGLHAAGQDKKLELSKGTRAMLAQEVRSPFAGTYRLSLRGRGGGSSRELFEQVFKQLSCRLVLFQFSEGTKSPADRQELASAVFQPAWVDPGSDEVQTFELTKSFENPKPGSNFSFGLGLGVAVIVEKTTAGTLQLPARAGDAWLLINSVELEFVGKERNDKVTV